LARERLNLSRSKILAFRRRVGALDERLPRGPSSLRRAAWAGLHDSMPRAALLSIHVRVRGATPTTWEDPSLVQLWGPRYSVYVVAARDLAAFSLGRPPDDPGGRHFAEDLADRLDAALNGSRVIDREARVVVHQRLELGHELGRGAEVEVCGDPFLERYQAQLLEPVSLPCPELGVEEPVEGTSPPQGERRAESIRGLRRPATRQEGPAARQLVVEVDAVDVVRRAPKRIAGSFGDEDAPSPAGGMVGFEGRSESCDVHLEALLRGSRRSLAPQGVRQRLNRDRRVRGGEEPGEQSSFLPPGDTDLSLVPPDPQRSEDLEPHGRMLGQRRAGTLPVRGPSSSA
jgi:hypothetical protein